MVLSGSTDGLVSQLYVKALEKAPSSMYGYVSCPSFISNSSYSLPTSIHKNVVYIRKFKSCHRPFRCTHNTKKRTRRRSPSQEKVIRTCTYYTRRCYRSALHLYRHRAIWQESPLDTSIRSVYEPTRNRGHRIRPFPFKILKSLINFVRPVLQYLGRRCIPILPMIQPCPPNRRH